MATETKTVKINGYTVTLELFTERADESRSECYVEKGRYSASLEACRAGKLTDERCNEIEISERDVDAIDSWATANGY
jgi:hypothetical protein